MSAEMHLAEFSGPCSPDGRYEIKLITIGPVTAKEVRNVIRSLELTAEFLAEDEAAIDDAILSKGLTP